MKNRIIAVVLAVLIGIFSFSTSFPYFVFASSYFESYFRFIQFIKSLDDSNIVDKRINALTPEGIKARSAVLEAFKPIKSSLPSDIPKSEYQQLLVYMMTSDNYEIILEKYGQDLALFYLDHEVELSDFLVFRIFPLFNGLEDFVDALFDTDLDGYGKDEKGNVQMPAIDFKKLIDQLNNTVSPKNPKMYKYSWRDLSNTQASYNSQYLGRTVGKNGYFFDGAAFADGVYVQPYLVLNGITYNKEDFFGEFYTLYQYHIYLEQTNGDMLQDSSGVSYPNITYTWKSDALFYLLDNGTPTDTFKSDIVSYSSSLSSKDVYDAAYYPYVNIGIDGSGLVYCSLYGSQVSSLTKPASYDKNGFAPKGSTSSDYIYSRYKNFYYSSDISKSLGLNYLYSYLRSGNSSVTGTNSGNNITLEDFEKLAVDDRVTDYGLMFSAVPFTTTFLFDPARIPSDSTITITGDTVYDYTITDNSTGDTTTIYNYYINNYEYPEDSDNDKDKDDDKGGGSLSGDVNVGGNVNVGGKVDVGGRVDIGGTVGVVVDFNVNGGNGGGSFGGGSPGYDYDLPDMSPLDEYLDEALEQSGGIRSFLEMFFSFIPGEIVLFLGIGLTVVILARIFGR